MNTVCYAGMPIVIAWLSSYVIDKQENAIDKQGGIGAMWKSPCFNMQILIDKKNPNRAREEL